MILIIGGYAQGRLAYVMENYNLKMDDVFNLKEEEFSYWNGQKIIYNAESLVTKWLREEKNPCKEIEVILPELKDTIVITQEVGCGLVPVTAEQRLWREEVGRFNVYLAENSETVIRVCCGLGMKIKS